MKNKSKQLRYIAYIRKSDEREERQELSHEAQEKEIKARFPDLNIIKWMEPESKSAFRPGRDIFNEMMDMIESGQAEGIVAWHPNRCSRNEVDTARVTWDLRGPLKDLKFCSFNFDNSPEGIWMLQNVMSQGQYESSKQGRDVKRGMEMKADKGERPGKVMPGYKKVPVFDENANPLIRAKDNKVITETGIDPERYDAIKQMWKWLLYSRLTPSQIWVKVNEELHFKTETFRYRRSDKIGGGGPMPKSMVYRIFRSPFYAGQLEHNGVPRPITSKSYQPMITWDEYKLAQQILGNKGNMRVGTFEFAFASMIRCGICGCLIQSRHVTKHIKSKNEYETYVYYYCSRKSQKRPCNQKEYTPVKDIERDVVEELNKYTIMPEFEEMALKILRRNHKIEASERGRAYKRLQERRRQLQSELDSLIDYLHRELLDEDDYKRKRNLLKAELDGVDSQLRNSERSADDSMAMNEKAFRFVVNARIQFQTGDVGTQRDVLRTLGRDLLLKDNKLYIEPNEWLIPIAEGYPALEKKYRWVGTNKKADPKVLEATLAEIMSTWRAQWDSNPRHPA